MKCLICGKEKFTCVHEGTRDIPTINVMKCQECGMVMLDSQVANTEENYSDGGMMKDAYSAKDDALAADMSWEQWIASTSEDDDRRTGILKDMCRGKDVLEFGCGNGGFLRRIGQYSKSVVGIELMDDARKRIADEGISVYKYSHECDKQYDVICLFMVIEHLNNPDKILAQLKPLLKPGGVIICDTPNAEDALISKYSCRAFEDFTYWSEHVYLYNSDTLRKLFEKNGFIIIKNTLMQRYGLANHLYWLSQGRPGGHVRWHEYDNSELNKRYAQCLIDHKIADTLWIICRAQDY